MKNGELWNGIKALEKVLDQLVGEGEVVMGWDLLWLGKFSFTLGLSQSLTSTGTSQYIIKKNMITMPWMDSKFKARISNGKHEVFADNWPPKKMQCN